MFVQQFKWNFFNFEILLVHQVVFFKDIFLVF